MINTSSFSYLFLYKKKKKKKKKKKMFKMNEIERKVMIRSRYYYLTSSVQYTKGKEGHTESNGTTIKTLQAESQKASFFPK